MELFYWDGFGGMAGGQGGPVEPDGGHREVALLHQVGEVGCYQCRGAGMARAPRAPVHQVKVFQAER